VVDARHSKTLARTFLLIAAAQAGSVRQAPRQLRPVTKMLAASISLGSGASLGPEGPSVELARTAYYWGRYLLSQERQRLLFGSWGCGWIGSWV